MSKPTSKQGPRGEGSPMNGSNGRRTPGGIDAKEFTMYSNGEHSQKTTGN